MPRIFAIPEAATGGLLPRTLLIRCAAIRRHCLASVEVSVCNSLVDRPPISEKRPPGADYDLAAAATRAAISVIRSDEDVRLGQPLRTTSTSMPWKTIRTTTSTSRARAGRTKGFCCRTGDAEPRQRHHFARQSTPAIIAAAQEIIAPNGGAAPDIGTLWAGAFSFSTEGSGRPAKWRTPICLTDHPANPPTPEDVVVRAKAFAQRMATGS